MNRRYVGFLISPTEVLVTPEFNGDKEQMAMFQSLFGQGDSCDKTWWEILDEFSEATTASEFQECSDRVQGYYHSAFGTEPPLPVERMLLEDFYAIVCDGLYLVNQTFEVIPDAAGEESAFVTAPSWEKAEEKAKRLGYQEFDMKPLPPTHSNAVFPKN